MTSVLPKLSLTDMAEFEIIVEAVFSNWSALQLAVDHGMGGSHQESLRKVADMVMKITSLCFSQKTSDWENIALELEDLMDSYFDTILEDESADEIAQLLWDLSRKWILGDKESPKTYVAGLKKPTSTKCSSAALPMETNESACGDNKIHNAPDDDGWTVVKRTR